MLAVAGMGPGVASRVGPTRQMTLYDVGGGIRLKVLVLDTEHDQVSRASTARSYLPTVVGVAPTACGRACRPRSMPGFPRVQRSCPPRRDGLGSFPPDVAVDRADAGGERIRKAITGDDERGTLCWSGHGHPSAKASTIDARWPQWLPLVERNRWQKRHWEGGICVVKCL